MQWDIVIVSVEVVVLNLADKPVSGLDDVGSCLRFLDFRPLWRLFSGSRLLFAPRSFLCDDNVIIVFVVFVLARMVTGRRCAQNFVITSITMLAVGASTTVNVGVLIHYLLFLALSQSLGLLLWCRFFLPINLNNFIVIFVRLGGDSAKTAATILSPLILTGLCINIFI